MTRKRLRLDFLEHPSGTGWTVFLNGSPVGDQFGTVGEVLAFAQSLHAAAQYAGQDGPRLEAEGGILESGDERTVVPRSRDLEAGF